MRLPISTSLLALIAWLAGAQVAPAQSTSSRTILLAGAAATAGALFLDETARQHFAAGDADDYPAWSDAGDWMGRGRWVAGGVIGTYAAARISGNEVLAGSSIRIIAGLAAAGVANGATKVAIGRQRPYGGDSWEFRPLNFRNAWQSFPSGHVVTTFALATAVSEEAGRPWVAVPLYGAATLVAASRMHEDKHWVSDVIGGATVGTAASLSMVRWLRRRGAEQRGSTAGGRPEVVLLPQALAVSIPIR